MSTLPINMATLWEFIQQEMNFCEDCESMVQLGPPIIDFLHPKQESIIGISCRLCTDGVKRSILVCTLPPDAPRPFRISLPDQDASVSFCEQTMLVVRPFEESDIQPTEGMTLLTPEPLGSVQ